MTKESRRESKLRWNRKNPECLKAAGVRYRERNLELCRQRCREYYHRNKERLRKKSREYHYANREKRGRYLSEWGKRNPKKLLEYGRKQGAKLNYRLSQRLRSRIILALKKQWKSGHTLELLGCPIWSFKIHLESLWEPGMNWDNYGRDGWHIDHIIPCALFDLSKAEHQRRCFHFSNLQPMWATENHRKNKYITDNQFRLL